MGNNMPGLVGRGSPATLTPLYPTGYDLMNPTQAMDFLEQMLDDSILQIYGEEYSRYFWYGVVVVIGLAAILNLVWRVTLKLRYFDAERPFKLNLDTKYS
jgi:ferric-chelate reductase